MEVGRATGRDAIGEGRRLPAKMAVRRATGSKAIGEGKRLPAKVGVGRATGRDADLVPTGTTQQWNCFSEGERECRMNS